MYECYGMDSRFGIVVWSDIDDMRKEKQEDFDSKLPCRQMRRFAYW